MATHSHHAPEHTEPPQTAPMYAPADCGLDVHRQPGWTNHYLCPCGARWEDQWECCCNDHCPACDKEIEPFISDDGSLSQEDFEAAFAVTLAAMDLLACVRCNVISPSADCKQAVSSLICPNCGQRQHLVALSETSPHAC